MADPLRGTDCKYPPNVCVSVAEQLRTRPLPLLSARSDRPKKPLGKKGFRAHETPRSSACPFFLCPSAVWGQGFLVNTATTTPQTLGDNDSGTITAAGSITLTGSEVNVTISGSNATLINSGTIL